MELYTEMSLVDPYAAWIFMCSWGDRKQHGHNTWAPRAAQQAGLSNSICGNLRSSELMQVPSWIMKPSVKC